VAATTRIPADPFSCIACSELDGLLGVVKYAHTYAPRAGEATAASCCCQLRFELLLLQSDSPSWSGLCLPQCKASPLTPHAAARPAGMMSCIPAPAGYVPVHNFGAGTTSSYEACPNGMFRDA
jgi:hypothetical protein